MVGYGQHVQHVLNFYVSAIMSSGLEDGPTKVLKLESFNIDAVKIPDEGKGGDRDRDRDRVEADPQKQHEELHHHF